MEGGREGFEPITTVHRMVLLDIIIKRVLKLNPSNTQ